MSTIEARAIVLNERNMGESNKTLVLLAKDIGKITVSARGARNQKSKLLNGTQVLCYSDFKIFKGNGFLSVNQIDLIRNFSSNYNDIFKLCYGIYFLELVDKTVMPEEEANDVMLLLLKALMRLEKDEPLKVSCAFRVKLFELLGFMPGTRVCPICGNKIENGCLHFSAVNGFVCDYCTDHTSFHLSESVTETIRYICGQESYNQVFMFQAKNGVLKELERVLDTIESQQMEIRTKSLDLLKSF